jgi:hypothetical protein
LLAGLACTGLRAPRQTIAAIDAHEFHFNLLDWNPTPLAKSPSDGSDEVVLLLPAHP